MHINGINQYFSFQDSHILLITHLSQCIHVTITIFSFVHKLESIPFCVCIYLSKETYWFHLFIMNTVIMKMGMQYLFENTNFSIHEHTISKTAELYGTAFFFISKKATVHFAKLLNQCISIITLFKGPPLSPYYGQHFSIFSRSHFNKYEVIACVIFILRMLSDL